MERITGSEAAHFRLASLLQRAVSWYTSAAVVMGIVLMVGGMRFFSLHQQPQAPNVWVVPLRVTVLACAITFSIGPVLSFLEGCGQVAQVARMRFFQSAVSVALSWTAMLEPSRIVFAGDGAAGAGICGEHPAATRARETAGPSAADACGAKWESAGGARCGRSSGRSP